VETLPVNNPAAWLQQAFELDHHGRWGEAERLYRQVLQADPRQPEAWHRLGLIAERAQQIPAAVDCLRRAIELQPRNPALYNSLGTIYEGDNQYRAAIDAFEAALRVDPRYATAHSNLGEVYKALGDVPRAIASYRAALAIDPCFFTCRSNLLMVLNYDPHTSPRQIFAEHCQWGSLKRMFAPPARTGHRTSRDPERPLKIGYLSPDFRKHAVARFFEPILRHHDRREFAVHLYAEIPKMDEVSERFRSLAQGWHRTGLVPTDQVVELIERDGIDMLVDLAGHTAHNRLDVFLHRPAPVQVTYLGYSNTTGLDSIDYRISDAVLDPVDEGLPMTETVVRLPGSFGCFEPPANSPPVSPSPRQSRGHVTFGSHHPLIKLNDEVLRLWRRVLEAIPDARLLFFRNQFHEPVAREFRARLAALGYPLERIEIQCPTSDEASYLRLFDEIDVILDTFPFNSHTMTCESLWMGVPIVTLRGDRPTARLSTSVLRQLDLPELCAATPDEFVTACQHLANDPQQLATLRQTLRDRLRTHLCDGATFTRHLEQLYRQMWRTWCGEQRR
jgi:predicted O-linked N-acetylglucosamine transferase (SPINDLY family)